MSKPRRTSYAVTSAELPVLKTLGLAEVDPEEVFELQRKEGAGAFGRVFRACYKSDRTRLAALKVIPVALEAGERGEDIESVRREIQFLRECDHPNVVAFHGAYYKDGALWVAMEHCAGGSVGDIRRVRALSEREISVIMRGALRGLAYLHSRRKIHRDVKGGNILLTDSGQVKIADFGVSAQLRDTLSRRGSFVGTPYWMSPELIQDSDYDFKADIWSLGITAIELADQKPPLFDEHPMRVLIQIPRNPPPQVAHPEKWSTAFLDFLRFCLRKDPAERPTAVECMKHEFIRREEHVERVFASGEEDEVTTLPHSAVKSTNESNKAPKEANKKDAISAPTPLTIEQELEDEIAEEISDEMADRAMSEVSVSSESDAEDGEASTELLGETFEFRDIPVQSSVSPSPSRGSPTPKLNVSASDDLLNLSVDDSFADLPPLSQVEHKHGQVQTRTTSQSSNTTSLRQPPTEFKLLPSSAKSPVSRGCASRDSSTRFIKMTNASGGALTSSSFTADSASKKPPRPSSPPVALHPKAMLSPSASPPVKSSWLSVSSSQDDPLASIDTITNARVNRLLSSFSSTSSPSLAAAMSAYNNQYAADTPNRSGRKQSFNWRSVEAALPSANSSANASFHDDPASTRSSGKIFVGDPFRASHDVCVKYNSIHAQYEGAPQSPEWVALHQQFGIALSYMRCRASTSQSSSPEDQVPALLRMLRRELVRHGGLRCKYIYRVSPIQEEVQRAKAAINRGSFEPAQISDPHVYASLVKLWLRELPQLLLDTLDIQDLTAVTKLVGTTTSKEEDHDGLHLVTPGNIDFVDVQITRTLGKLGVRENAVFQWLLEHMLEVNAHRSSNQMTTQALATVVAPNLFSSSKMMRSQQNAGDLMRQLVLFLRVLLSWRRANLGSSPTAATFLLEQEEKNVAAAFSSSAETPISTGKSSMLQQRVRQSLTRIVKGSEFGPESDNDAVENVSLETVLRNRVDRLWSELEKSEVTTVETNRQEHVLRCVFSEFQQSMLHLIAHYSKRSEECTWANNYINKLNENRQPEMKIPVSLEKMKNWVAAALTFDAFCRLLDREQNTQEKLERLQARFGGKGIRRDNNQLSATTSNFMVTQNFFSHLTRVHQQQIKADVASVGVNAQSNQSEDKCASTTENLLLNGAIHVTSSSNHTGNDLGASSRLHRNIAKLGEHQPAVGNLLVLLGDCSQTDF
ncbi:STE/STE20/MST protein kinase [Phytophthora megakarya]|uniref:STE/STE20/MST protein kinase n=1 Tax=Phytophthora megakarya TaxID=4795 RepID=A0A225WI86_9STRA|nr:STE/STE20/MST protein kinase [Phytophthora megakarya]